MDLYPAIDLRAGRAVRLTQGDFDRETSYGDPLDLARRFVAGGAPWLHVVDLDAARTGRPVNRSVVLDLAAHVGVPVQTGGGVRTMADIDALIGGGVARVILGTAALDDPTLAARACEAYPGKVALGLDYRGGSDGRAEVAVRGWEEGSGRTVSEVLADVAGTALAAVITTSIDRDGMLGGPDLNGLAEILASTPVPVIASGGVASVDDLVALARLRSVPHGGGPERRLLGAITGKALVDGRLRVEEGVAACTLSE